MNEKIPDWNAEGKIPSQNELMFRMFLTVHSQLQNIKNTANMTKNKQNEIIEQLSEVINNQSTNFEAVLKELKTLKERETKQQELERRREKRRNRLRLEKRDPITEAALLELKAFIRKHPRLSQIQKSRLLVFCTLMFLIGVGIMEAAGLEFAMTDNLFLKQRRYISIKRTKTKQEATAYLLTEKKHLITDVADDYKLIKQISGGKGYIFCRVYRGDNTKKLDRSSVTRAVNNILKSFVQYRIETHGEEKTFLEKKWLSHSFRINYVTSCWKSQGDIEFVRQLVGHANVQTTSSYIKELTHEEKVERLLSVNDAYQKQKEKKKKEEIKKRRKKAKKIKKT